MGLRLASAGAAARLKESRIAPEQSTPEAPGVIGLSGEVVRGSARPARSGDKPGMNPGPAEGSRPDALDQAEYVTEWDPRLD